MQISVELTFTPLQDDFEEPIKIFIKKLRNSGFDILENPLSTHIYGDYKQVMAFLTEAMEGSLGSIDLGLMNLKIVKTDRSKYEPDF